MVIRIIIGLLTLLLILPGGALAVGDKLSSTIQSSKNSSIPWRRAKLAYRVAKFSPFFWSIAAEGEHQADLELSNNFFEQVLRGEQDAIVPEDHLKFLEGRPNTEEWKVVRLYTLLQYGKFDEVVTLASKFNNPNSIANIATVAALYNGDQEALEEWLPLWSNAPKMWWLLTEQKTELPIFQKTTEWQSHYANLEERDKPIYIEHLLLEGISTDEISEIIKTVPNIEDWQCAHLTFANQTKDIERLTIIINELLKRDLFISVGTILKENLCHSDRFSTALEYATEELKTDITLLKAHAQITQLQISKAQKTVKELMLLAEQDNDVELTKEQQILIYHIRTLARELSGDPSGMEKYATLGSALNKPIFVIPLARSQLYLQAKTSARQLLSSLNGYPIPEKFEQEYKDMWSFARRLTGSEEKFSIGSYEMSHDFMNDDGDYRSWLVQYLAENTDKRNGTHIGLITLRYWRGEDRHGDQLLRTHLELNASIASTVQKAHQRFLHASIRQDKQLTSTTWKKFSATQQWLLKLDYPQMLRTHEQEFETSFPRLQ
jgi:hypothetical protein